MIGAIILVAITVVLLVVIFLLRVPYPTSPPTLSFAAVNNAKYPAWGDPTDCYPNLPHNWEYYLANGTGNRTDQNLYNTYMDAWWDDCEYGDSGYYAQMNATGIIITGTSQPIPLSAIEFQFICTNTTPRPSTTYLVNGALSAMEWVPGGSQNLSANAPTLGTCASYDPRANSGANSVYYNRLGFFDPLNTHLTTLAPGMTLVLYVHTKDSIFEAPNPLYDESYWNQPDTDDYHGAPLWCFTVPGSCTVQLIDTDWTSPVVILSVPVWEL